MLPPDGACIGVRTSSRVVSTSLTFRTRQLGHVEVDRGQLTRRGNVRRLSRSSTSLTSEYAPLDVFIWESTIVQVHGGLFSLFLAQADFLVKT